MKNQFTILAILALILLSTFVIAERFESNIFRYAEIDASGNLIATSTPVTGVSVFGVICNDATCSTTQGILYNGEFNVTTDNTILNYSTTLQSPFGYGIYFYKKGYIPFEVSANWAGTDANDPVGPFTNYLTKQRDCRLTLSTPTISISGNNATVTLSTLSPINNSGPLAGIPSQISQYYNLDINVSATANGTTQTRTISVPFSSSRTAQFNFILPAGNHTLSVSATTNNDLCVNTLPTTNQISNFTITATTPVDTTPPSTISSLSATNRNLTTITWNWTNPSNSDFNQSIISLNGINVLNTSSPFYTATGLISNTTYTLSVLTKDNSGNINTTAVTSTTSTLPLTANQTLPTISIVSPLNITYNTPTVLISLSTANATQVFYSIDSGANITYTSPINITFTPGSHTLRASASNSLGTTTSSVTFAINSSVVYGIPTITISSPLNNTSYNVTSVLLNISSPNATSINYTLNNQTFIYTSPVFLTGLVNGSYNLTVRASNPSFTRNSTITFTINTTTSGGSGGGGGGNNGGNNNGNVPTTNNKKFPDLTPQDKKVPVDYTEYEDTTSNNVANKKGNSINLIWILPTTLLLLIILLCLLLFVLLYKKK
ncbi:MAG: hypothetical protein AABX35_03260 [Nanoarchaeota archaeon]